MIVLGLLFILTAVGAVAFAVVAPSSDLQTIELSAVGVTVSASPLAMFVAGALSLFLFALGLVLINRGSRRRASSRKELRELRKGHAEAATQGTTDAGRHASGHDRSASASGAGTTPGANTDHAATDPAKTSPGATPTDAAADSAATPDSETTDGTSLDAGSRDTDKSANTDSTADKGTDSSH